MSANFVGVRGEPSRGLHVVALVNPPDDDDDDDDDVDDEEEDDDDANVTYE